MPRWDDEDEDGWESDDEVGKAFGEEDEGVLDHCPHCRRLIYDDAERCPKCGAYLSLEQETGRKPWWLVVGVAACLYAVYRWVVGP